MTQVDLRDLARERPGTQPPVARRKRSFWTRVALPAVIIAGFVSLLGWAVRDRLLPRRPVSVVPVVVTRAEVQRAGTPLFQAAGWIEPRPTSIHVASLTEGVVQDLLVVEGQDVEQGEPVARLVDVDARLALREAEAALQLREAELQSAQAELKAARLRVENPVHLQAALADAESLLAKTETELAKLPFAINSLKAQVQFARQNLAGKRAAGVAVTERSLQLAESEVAQAQAELRELQQREPWLRREVEALQRKQAALAEQLKLLIDESRQLEDTTAKLQAAEARRDQARLAVEKARLALERTVVVSPVAGRVMQLVAHPGTRVQGRSDSSGSGSATVVTLYDPQMLQVRADVRLEDVPLVQPGQPVEIETASSEQPLRGVVLRSTSAANIQKNTLEVKVAIEDPVETLRPEMLVTATFLAPTTGSSEQRESDNRERLLVPRPLVESSDAGQAVWIVDGAGLARRRQVQLGRAGTEQLVEVTRGLTPTDKLIADGRDSLQEGDRVEVEW